MRKIDFDKLPEELPEDFGPALRCLRESVGIGLRSLAKWAGISHTYLSRIERGHVDPPAAHIISDLEKGIGLLPGTLLARSGRMPDEVAKLYELAPGEVWALATALAQGRAAPNQEVVRELVDSVADAVEKVRRYAGFEKLAGVAEKDPNEARLLFKKHIKAWEELHGQEGKVRMAFDGSPAAVKAMRKEFLLSAAIAARRFVQVLVNQVDESERKAFAGWIKSMLIDAPAPLDEESAAKPLTVYEEPPTEIRGGRIQTAHKADSDKGKLAGVDDRGRQSKA